MANRGARAQGFFNNSMLIYCIFKPDSISVPNRKIKLTDMWGWNLNGTPGGNFSPQAGGVTASASVGYESKHTTEREVDDSLFVVETPDGSSITWL